MPLLDRNHTLASGQRVRLRMARSSDARALRELAARRGFEASPLEVARMTRFDPRHRLVISATALIDARETLVGLGAMELDQGEPFEPDTLIYDERVEGLGALLVAALAARARAIAPSRAA